MTLQNPVRLDGTYDERVPDFQGKLVRDHNPEIVAALDAAGRLFREIPYEHAYPHCWRCDTPLLYYAKASWYLRTSEVRDRMLAENERIGWHPEHIKHGRFGKWLEGNVDWALSRERYWGTPLPVWECTGGGLRRAGLRRLDRRDRASAAASCPARRRARSTSTAPTSTTSCSTCESCGGEMRRVPEVIDTWYDSGAMPFAQLHYPFENEEEFERRFPADFICEAIDQTRGWFYSQLAESVLLFDQTDYLNCVCLGLILDPEGRKMSKRLGNLVDPHEVIDAHGADAFRWYYLASQQPWAGYRFSADTVGESVRQFLLTLWNTYSFFVLYANAETTGDRRPRRRREAEAALDRWLLSRLQATTETVRERARRLRLDDRRQGDRRVRRRDVELVRARLAAAASGRATPPPSRRCATASSRPRSCSRRSSRSRPTRSGSNLVHGAEPPLEVSVHLEDYPEADASLRDPGLEAGVEAARRAVELGRAARAQAKVKMRQPLAQGGDRRDRGRARGRSRRFADVVRAELNVRELEFVTEEGELASWTVKPNFRRPRPPLRQGDAAGQGRGRGARRRPRPRDDRRRRPGRDQRSTAASTRSAPTS